MITYILILEENNYIEFNWKWDKDNDKIKELVKQAILKYYKSFNDELFYFIYCSIKCWNNGGEIKSGNWVEDPGITTVKSYCKFKDPFKYFDDEIGMNAPEYLKSYIDYIKKKIYRK